MPHDPQDDAETITVGGVTSIEKVLGWRANTVYVENFTNQYVSLPDVPTFVPPYTARLLNLPGVMKAKFKFAAPPGLNQVASIAGQVCTATWSELSVPSLGGPIGPIGVTSNYYDRNPLSIVFNSFINNLAPHAATSRWTYTVPSNRKAFLELGEVLVVLEAAGDLAVSPGAGSAVTAIAVTPTGGLRANIIVSNIQDKAAKNTVAGGIAGSSIELQAGDVIEGRTSNTYTATNTTHGVQGKFTEFDA